MLNNMIVNLILLTAMISIAEGQVSGYSFPISNDKIKNWDTIFTEKVPALMPVADLVKTQGFGAVSTQSSDFIDELKRLDDRGVPVFLSTDIFLHLYHLQFDETLKWFEETSFYSELMHMCIAMETYLSNYAASETLRPSINLALNYVRLILSCGAPA
jgi:hypothetical protein